MGRPHHPSGADRRGTVPPSARTQAWRGEARTGPGTGSASSSGSATGRAHFALLQDGAPDEALDRAAPGRPPAVPSRRRADGARDRARGVARGPGTARAAAAGSRPIGRARARVRRVRPAAVPAHRPGRDHGDHPGRARVGGRGAAARAPGRVARGSLLHAGGVPRAGRDPRGRRTPRGRRGDRRRGRRGDLLRQPALAAAGQPDAGLPGPGASDRRSRSTAARSRTRGGSPARR